MPIYKGYHWSVRANAARRSEEKEELPFRGTIFAKITSALADFERVTVSSFMGDKVVSFAYPFASTNAWIRGQPEPATTMLTIIGADSKDLLPIGYFDAAKATAAKNYSEMASGLRRTPSLAVPKTQPYRVLAPGDIDMASNFAQTFMGLNDVHQSRGGLSHFTMTSQHARVDSPLFEVRGPAHALQATGALTDEVRFGVVRRSTLTSNPTSPALIRGPYPSDRLDAAGMAFAKEWSVILNQRAFPDLPTKLIDHRQGIVVEDDGTLARSQRTGKNLRARARWFTLIDETKAEVDDDGNWLLSTGLNGTEGGTVTIPTGNLLIDVGQKLTMRSRLEMEIASQLSSLNVSAATGFRVATPARGEVEGTFALALKSSGIIQINTPTPMGVSIGTEAGVKYPVLVGNPAYLGSLQGWYSSEVTLDNLIGNYGQMAAQAWAAIGPLTMALDPSGTVMGLCLAAGGAAAAMSAAGFAANGALAAHMPSIQQMPAGFVSNKTVSE